MRAIVRAIIGAMLDDSKSFGRYNEGRSIQPLRLNTTKNNEHI